jgi:ABC-type polar amino acid transport system ATPase subunit
MVYIEEKKNIIIEHEKRRDSISITIQQIEKYKEYEKMLDNWEKFQKQKNELELKEVSDRKRLTSASIFRDKLLEAESISIQNMIENINTHVQLYLEYFFPDNPINVRISAFKENKKEQTKPSINLEIDYKGIEHDLTMLSGGELSRIILAFTLALAEIHNSPLILLDECTSSLDQELTNSVISGLKENFGNKLVVLIAHQVVQGCFDKIIKLT